MRCVAPRGAFYAMPQLTLPPGRTDQDFVLGLLRAKGILCVYGSGFGAGPPDGMLPHRVSRLARRAGADLRRHRRLHAGVLTRERAGADSADRRPSNNDPRRLIVFGVLVSIAGVLLVAVLYQVRSVLLLAYVSALFAMGISPLVQMIERRRLLPIGARLPRWLAILIIYAAVIGVARRDSR